MLRVEDYQTGVGCTELQKEYLKDLPAMRSVSNRQLRRKMLVISVAPKPEDTRRASEPSRFVPLEKFDPDHLIVPASEADVYLMFDRPVQSDKPEHRVETLVLGETGYLDNSGTPCIGGDEYHNFADYDYGSKPFHACQGGEVRLYMDGYVTTPLNGTFRVRRIGSFLDLCVGDLSDRSPMIIYRINVGHCEGESASASIKGLAEIPENGAIVTVGPVSRGDVVLQLKKKVELYKAGFLHTGRPHVVTKAKKLVPAHREREFELFIKMNRSMLKHTPKKAGDSRTFLTDPTKWAFSVLFRFEDIASVVHSDQFVVTPQLQNDLLEAVGPRGIVDRAGRHWYLQIRAATTSRVAAINTDNATDLKHVEIVYEDGTTQLVPDYPHLSDPLVFTYQADRSRKPLDVGDEVRLNQVIGDFVPRLSYLGWKDLRDAMGPNLLFAITEFLTGRSVKPGKFGWEGPDYLLDYRYCYPVIDQLGVRDGREKLLWYWDLRNGANYLDRESGYIIYPPMRYQDWNNLTMSMKGVSYFLGLHSDKVRSQRASRKRDKKKTTQITAV